MDVVLKQQFLNQWKKYLGNVALPIAFYYSNTPVGELIGKNEPGCSRPRCVIAQLSEVRQGKSLCFSAASSMCFGGQKYLGFRTELMESFPYFLSCGIPGKVEGERYKKSPELVREVIRTMPHFEAPSPFLVFKRWDELDETDRPEVVIFFASPDVLSGLFALSNFDRVEPNGVFVPFASGCGASVQFPYLEKDAPEPRAVLGLFDVSARPFVAPNELSFAVPFKRFVTLVGYMQESFLMTDSWARVRERIESGS